MSLTPSGNFIANADEVSVRFLPGITNDAKRTLARHLVKKGILQIVDDVSMRPDEELEGVAGVIVALEYLWLATIVG